MTILNTAKLNQGKYDDATFEVQETSIEGGRKKVSHEYPNTKQRYIEDLGGLEKKFSITAWTDDNINYEQRNTLIEALEKEDTSTLYLPSYTIENVIAISYTVTDSIKQLGVSKFVIYFERGSLNESPNINKGNKGLLAKLKNTLLGKNETLFAKAVKSVKNSKANFDSLNQTVKNTARRIDRVSQTVSSSVNTFGDFATSINQIVASTGNLVQTPEILASKINFALSNLELAYASSKNAFKVFKELFGMDEKDQEANGNSTQQQDIRGNQNQVANLVNASVLAISYNIAANITFETLDELNETITALEDGFAKLPPTLDGEIYDDLVTMKIEATKIFGDLSISLPNIINYEVTTPTSLNVLTYSLYGSLELKNTIKNLNKLVDTSYVVGKVKVLSDV